MLFNFILCMFFKLNQLVSLSPVTLYEPEKSKGPCYFVTPDKMCDFFLNSCFTTGDQLAITIVLCSSE